MVTVVYIKQSEVEAVGDREPVIAHIARAIHDYFAFNPRPAPGLALRRRRRQPLHHQPVSE